MQKVAFLLSALSVVVLAACSKGAKEDTSTAVSTTTVTLAQLDGTYDGLVARSSAKPSGIPFDDSVKEATATLGPPQQQDATSARWWGSDAKRCKTFGLIKNDSGSTAFEMKSASVKDCGPKKP